MDESKRKNVIVVGAGASQEFGFPTGKQLTHTLRVHLDFRLDDWGKLKPGSGNRRLIRAIEHFSYRQNKNPKYYYQLCRFISENMPLAPSIDNFLDTHRDDDDLVFMGKIAIANAIIEAENQSKLKIDQSNIYNRLNFDSVEESWTAVFFKLIAAKRNYDSFLSALANITFISFNYDQCIKQFFVNAATSYFGLEPHQTDEVLTTLEVIHPYGSIGEMKTVVGRTEGFAPEANPEAILTGANRINTFTQRISDDRLQAQIQLAFEQAQLVIFLGFSFTDINMEILKPTLCKADRVLATAKGRSEDTKSRIANELYRKYSRYNDDRGVEMFNGKCFELFYEYDHYLTSIQP